MTEGISFVAALLLGLAGAGHCIGMCGGIVSGLSLSSSNASAKPTVRSKVLNTFVYNVGRIGSYVLMGLIVGWGASWLKPGGWPIARTLAGLMLLLMGLHFLGWRRGILVAEKLGGLLWKLIQPLTKAFFPANSALKVLFLGALWGWLPCGLVYSTLVYAAAQENSVQAALTMFAFGLGTMPALFLSGLAATAVQDFLRSKYVSRLMGAMFIIFAIWTLYGAWYHVLMHGAGQGADSHQHMHHHH